MSGSGGAAARVRSLRLAKSMTLAELSRQSGLPISTQSKIENDKVSPSYDRLQKLSIGLGVDISYFVTSNPAMMAISHALGRRGFTVAGSGAEIRIADQTYHYHADRCSAGKSARILSVCSTPYEEQLASLPSVVSDGGNQGDRKI